MNRARKLFKTTLIGVLCCFSLSAQADCGLVMSKLFADVYKIQSKSFHVACKRDEHYALTRLTNKMNRLVKRFNRQAAKLDPDSCDPDAYEGILNTPIPEFSEADTQNSVNNRFYDGNFVPLNVFCNGDPDTV